ncbi:hypothetical protein, partial [Enterococcus faecium]|uniref:hypothetical protein n=1 Tax=Enterococcus faecium TaxID=1352 RepID=UPI001CEF8703
IKKNFVKMAFHILHKFRLISEKLLLNTVYQRLRKSCPASSNKNSQTKIVPHILRLVELITADASF